MTERKKWRLLRAGLRAFGAAATVGTVVLAAAFVIEKGLVGEYSTAEMVMDRGRWLAGWLLLLPVLLCGAALLVKRVLGSDSWGESLRLALSSVAAGVKPGLGIALLLPVAAAVGMLLG